MNDPVKEAIYQEIRKVLYNLKPFQKIYISADPNGKPDVFRIDESRTIIISGLVIANKDKK